MKERDIDVLLDRYTNALLLHGGDRHQAEECEHCRVVRARIKEVVIGDTGRLDWLDEGDNYFLVTPATNMIGARKGWTHRVGRSLDSIGERFLDIRQAIDKARKAE